VHGGDWSWKSLILGWKEAEKEKYCSFDIFPKELCNLCYKTVVTVGHINPTMPIKILTSLVYVISYIPDVGTD